MARSTDHLDMTIAIDWDIKQQTIKKAFAFFGILLCMIFYCTLVCTTYTCNFVVLFLA